MAISITIDKDDGRYVQGNRYVRKGYGNLGIYATGGVAFTPATFDLSSISQLDVANAGGYVFEWDKTNQKIKAYRQKDPAAPGGADIPMPEVANAVDLSTVTFRFRVDGN